MSANDVTHTPDPAIEAIIRDHASWAGGLMPALHAVQHHAGYIDRGYIPLLARTFNLSVAEVHGVITFYKDFRTTPPRGPIVQVCRAEACTSRGGDKVWAAMSKAPEWAQVEIEEVFCLGNCALGPTVSVAGCVRPIRDEGDVEVAVRVALEGPAPVSIDSVGEGVTVYVPRDAAARGEGADHVADALAATPGVRVVRTGSRGMLWLEPMIEVATSAGRVGYGPVGAADVGDLLAAGMLEGGEHPLRLGLVEE
ncbi:MAG: NAD(P)H-dependent oxidoreductase subunit E, partial [Ilumatobacteraceae bacterium]